MRNGHLHLALLAFLIPLGIHAKSNKAPDYAPQITKWRRVYYVDYFKQTYKNAIASFIAYLIQDTPSSKTFDKEFKAIYTAFTNPIRDFHLALVKLFENAFLEAYKTGTCETGAWTCMLKQYYQCTYDMLDKKHRNFNYGERKDSPLPLPETIIPA